MRSELICDLLSYLNPEDKKEISEELAHQITAMNIPEVLKRVLQWSWFDELIDTGSYYIHGVEFLLRDDTFLDKLLEHDMLFIGESKNGDILVIKFYLADESCEVCLINHEEFWNEDIDLDNKYTCVSNSLEEFLYRLAEGLFLPVDYFSARELNQLKHELEN